MNEVVISFCKSLISRDWEWGWGVHVIFCELGGPNFFMCMYWYICPCLEFHFYHEFIIFALDMECMVYVGVNCQMCYSMWWYIMLKINNTTHVYLVILPSCRRARWWAWRKMMVNRCETNMWHKVVRQTCRVTTKQNVFLLFCTFADFMCIDLQRGICNVICM